MVEDVFNDTVSECDVLIKRGATIDFEVDAAKNEDVGVEPEEA